MTFKYDFSIIIPVYNSAKYLNKCIESVLQQDYDLDKIQIILIDDGSVDQSLSICKNFKEQYKNIVLIHQSNQGVSVARNHGVKKARGKYILFLDSDDYLSNNVCSSIFPFFEKNYNKIDLVVYNLKYKMQEKTKPHFRYSKLYDNQNKIYNVNVKNELIQTTINYCIKNKYDDNLLFNKNFSFGEDEMYATNIILRKRKFGYCSDCTYYYRMHGNNTVHNNMVTFKVFKKFVDYYLRLLKDYPNNDYVMNLVLNNLRWRLEENKLVPYTENEKLQKQFLNKIKELLDFISVERIMKLSYLKVRTRMALLHLKDIPYEVTLKDEQVIVTFDKQKYKYKNQLLVKIENIGKTYISGKIEKSFDLFAHFTNPNLTVVQYPIYEKSYINSITEYTFSLKLSNFKCNISEALNDYHNIKIDAEGVNNLFYTLKTKDMELMVIKRPLKNLLKELLRRMGLLSIIRKVYKKGKSFLKRLLQKIRRSSNILLYKYYCKRVPLDKNNVLFLSASRESLTGNFEFVYHELKENYHYEINLVLKKSLKTKNSLKEQIHLMKLIASSKYILLDDFYPMIYTLKLRKGTELIQLWHAMGAFKTVGYSRMGKVGGPSVKSLTHKNYTATIVSSENIRKNYAEAFDISIDKVHALGVPRTDIFFDNNYKKNITKKLHEKYPFIKDKKVILFAPTFRGNGQKSAYYNFSWLDFNKMKEQLQDQYVFLIKLHPFITARPDIVDNQFYFDLSDEREINDLLFITDILITDYSSVIFEYSFFKKPVVFFIPDYKEYVASRDFYYDFDKYMYGSTAINTDELIKKIKKEKVNKKKIDAFTKYFCSACDGKSTKRVVKELIVNKK